MFTKLDFRMINDKKKIKKFLVILKILAKSVGSYSTLSRLSNCHTGRELICFRLTGCFMNQIQNKDIYKVVKTIGRNQAKISENNTPVVMV